MPWAFILAQIVTFSYAQQLITEFVAQVVAQIPYRVIYNDRVSIRPSTCRVQLS